MKNLLVFFSSFFVFTLHAQLVLNEVSQGTGSQEYVEVLVVGTKTCTDSCVDLRGWFLDDNNGWHAAGPSVGIADGCVRFKNIPQWQCVKFGTIILYYNSGTNKNPAITLADDLNDANNDGVYIIPWSNNSVFDKDTISPNTSTTSYATFTPAFGGPGAFWSQTIGMRNAGDAFHTVSPANLNVPHHSLTWGDNTLLTNIYFAGSAASRVHAMKNLTSDDPFLQANWDAQLVASGTNETPGTPNNAANAAWITALKNQVALGSKRDTVNPQICQGQSYTTKTGPKTIAATYIDTFTTGGCDSIVITILSVGTFVSVPVPISACGQVVYKGTTYTTSTNFNDTIKSLLGCDSVINNVAITIRNASTTNGNETICSGQSFFVGGANQTTGGIYQDVYTATNGCDSTVNTNLTVLSVSNSTQTVVECKNFTYKGTLFTNSATILDTFKYVNYGCDSVRLTINLTITSNSVIVNRPICILQGQSFFVAGSNKTVAGIYRDTTSLINGCDSFTITDLKVITSSTISNVASGCKQLTFKGNTYTNSTLVRDTLRTALGCDSIYTNTSIVIFTNDTAINKEVCILRGQSYNAGGANQTTSGTYTDNFTRATGCDSIINTRLQVIDTLSNIVNVPAACGSVTYNGTTYNSSTVLTNKILSRLGCDSAYNLVNITVNQIPATVTQAACINPGQSYTVGTNTYTASGNFTDVLIAANGCDSTVKTNLTLITPSTSSINIDGCDTVSFGSTVYTANATVNNTILSAQGCDSVFSTVQIRVHPTYSYKITADKTMPLEAGESVTLSSNFNGTSPYYNWKPNQFITSGNNQPTITVSPTLDIVYTVDYFVSDSTCKMLDTFRVTVKQLDLKFELPNAFSPNNDGVNELFRVLMQPGLELKAFRVFNRWGELVFEEKSKSTGWDGKYKDSDQPVGVYVYYVEIKNLSTGKTINRSGNVTLLR